MMMASPAVQTTTESNYGSMGGDDKKPGSNSKNFVGSNILITGGAGFMYALHLCITLEEDPTLPTH
jgi:hypothetical protein